MTTETPGAGIATAKPALSPPTEHERLELLAALRAGVPPTRGTQHIQVGRGAELEAVVGDLRRVARGGAAFRIVTGDYGAGKTYFLNTVRDAARRLNLVTVHADLGPNRRLQATDGQAQNLLAHLVGTMSTTGAPQGGGLAAVVEGALEAVRLDPVPNAVSDARPDARQNLFDAPGGPDLLHVMDLYRQGYEQSDHQLRNNCLRWIGAGYRTLTEARRDLGVRAIVDDRRFYDHLKLLATLVRVAGYAGLLVTIDEMGTLARLSNTRARKVNYEQSLHILNDTSQGNATGIGVFLAGTPDWVDDPRLGMHSDPALRTRLRENQLLPRGADLTDPVLRLRPMTPEEQHLLLCRVAQLYAGSSVPLSNQEVLAFLSHQAQRSGSEQFAAPRDVIRTFLHALESRRQRPGLAWSEVITGRGTHPTTQDTGPGPRSPNAPLDRAKDDMPEVQL